MFRRIVRMRFSSSSVRSDNEWRTTYVLRLALPGNAGRAIPPEESALPARTAPPFRHGNCCSGGRASSFTLQTDSCQPAFGMLLNMVSSVQHRQPVHPATMNMLAPILAQHDQDLLSVLEPFFLPRFLRRTSDIQYQHIEHINGLIQRRSLLRFNECCEYGQFSAVAFRAIYFTDAMPA